MKLAPVTSFLKRTSVLRPKQAGRLKRLRRARGDPSVDTLTTLTGRTATAFWNWIEQLPFNGASLLRRQATNFSRQLPNSHCAAAKPALLVHKSFLNAAGKKKRLGPLNPRR